MIFSLAERTGDTNARTNNIGRIVEHILNDRICWTEKIRLNYKRASVTDFRTLMLYLGAFSRAAVLCPLRKRFSRKPHPLSSVKSELSFSCFRSAVAQLTLLQVLSSAVLMTRKGISLGHCA